MHVLRTPTNATGGLVSEIRHCVARFEQQWAIETVLQVADGLEPLVVSTQVEMQFVRILQESLMNILRHATASRVTVTLTGDPTRLAMCIQDDGRGFDRDSVSVERLGLQIMSERAEALGGMLTIQSERGIGTRVSVDVPLYARPGSGCA
jgi:signal transduction histidine kinase